MKNFKVPFLKIFKVKKATKKNFKIHFSQRNGGLA